jgi:hypothetical protein
MVVVAKMTPPMSISAKCLNELVCLCVCGLHSTVRVLSNGVAFITRAHFCFELVLCRPIPALADGWPFFANDSRLRLSMCFTMQFISRLSQSGCDVEQRRLALGSFLRAQRRRCVFVACDDFFVTCIWINTSTTSRVLAHKTQGVVK